MEWILSLLLEIRWCYYRNNRPEIYIFVSIFVRFFEQQLTWDSFFRIKVGRPKP